MKRFITSSSIVAVKEKDKTVIGVDKQLSYGSLAKYSVKKLVVRNQTVLAFSGEYSDAQTIVDFLKNEEDLEDNTFDPQGYFRMIQRFLYTKRSKFEPLNVHCVVAGLNFLGSVDHLGNFFESDAISTKLGHHIVLPYLRESNDDIVQKVKTSLDLLYKRDCQGSNEIEIAVITPEGIKIIDEKIIVDWELGRSPDEILIV